MALRLRSQQALTQRGPTRVIAADRYSPRGARSRIVSAGSRSVPRRVLAARHCDLSAHKCSDDLVAVRMPDSSIADWNQVEGGSCQRSQCRYTNPNWRVCHRPRDYGNSHREKPRYRRCHRGEIRSVESSPTQTSVRLVRCRAGGRGATVRGPDQPQVRLR